MSEKKKIEIRCGLSEQYRPHFREATEEGKESRTIEGYAVVFEVESRIICDWCDVYREIIHKGAVTDDMLKNCDIKMTIWHKREMLLARSNMGAGTLSFTVDDIGVKYSFEAPHTPAGDTALELVKRGDLSGSSFSYWTDETHNVRYTKGADDVLIRHVDKIDNISEMTIAADPAYMETSVTAREVTAHGVDLTTREQRNAERKRIDEQRKAIRDLRELTKYKL